MLTILTTHPIQYQVPLWRALAASGQVDFVVAYMSRHGLDARLDPGFGKAFAWDIDVLSGYPHVFVPAVEGPRQESPLWLRLDRGFGSRLRARGTRTLLINGWQVAAYWQAAFVARRLGLEVWMRGDTNLKSKGHGLRQTLKAPALRLLLGRIDRFMVTGKANYDFYRAYGVSREKLYPTPHCIDNHRFAAEATRLRPMRAELRARWGVPEDATCVLFVGKLIGKKRPLDLIEAMRRTRALRPERPLHLLVAGTGELAGRMRARCRVVYDAEATETFTQPLADDRPGASFLGFLNQTELPRAYAAADMLALPSEATETWGLVVNEAMASGLPAVVSDAVGCADDLVRPLGEKYVFPLGDTEALARALLRMAEEPPPASQIAERIARYAPDATVATLERLCADTGR